MREQKEKKQLMKGYLILAGLVLSLAVFLFFSVMLIRTLHAYRVDRDKYRAIAEQYALAVSAGEQGVDPDPGLSSEPGAVSVQQSAAYSEDDPETVTLPFRIDWESIMKDNPDTVGWLYSEGTPIHYPVVQGSDNEYYLTHDFGRKKSAAGALFLDARNELYSEVDHLMIYGHRMKDDSMLGSAADYAKEQYYRQHPYLYFLTPEQSWRAEIIGCRTVHADEKYFPVLFGDEEAYAAYLRKIRSQRYYETDAEPDTSFRLLTLVTCSTYTRGGDVRLLVHARLVPVKIAS